MTKLKKIISPALLVIAAMIWGFAFSAQKEAEAVPAFTLGAVRSIFATVFLAIVIVIKDRITGNERSLFREKRSAPLTKTELIGGVICGAALATASFFQQIGISSGTDAGKASFITALYVVIVPIYALLLKKSAPLNVWLGVGIAIVGFYLLCITGDLTMVPSDALVLLCSFIFPIQILAIDAYSPRCDGVRMSLVQFFVAFIINLIFALILESPIDFSLIGAHIGSLLFLGIGSSGIAYTLQIIGQKGANPAAASILLSLESVFGVIGSAIFLGESMSTREYIGCAVVFLAVLLSEINVYEIIKSKRQNKASS